MRSRQTVFEPVTTFSEIFLDKLTALREQVSAGSRSRRECDEHDRTRLRGAVPYRSARALRLRLAVSEPRGGVVSNERQLEGQTVVVIRGSSGIGFETARRARDEGASVIITGRDPDRVHRAGLELGASIAAFDVTDLGRVARFFAELPGPIDHLLLSGAGPDYTPFAELEPEAARRDLDTHLLLPLQVARYAAAKIRPGGTMLLIGGTGGRTAAAGPVITAVAAALPAMTRSLALELAPVRVNLVAPGFVETPLSAAILGGQLDARRDQLRTALPIRRVVGPEDVAALAVHLMTNTAVTGATFDIDGGQQLVT